MMEEIKQALEKFKRDYRRHDLPPLELSGLYALFPQQKTDVEVQKSWNDIWPDAGRAGVYFIFGEKVNLLYVGKSQFLGRRLTEHFGYDSATEGCRINEQGWKEHPMYVATVAVPMDLTYEKGALEEFLIAELSTTCPDLSNAIGVKRAATTT